MKLKSTWCRRGFFRASGTLSVVLVFIGTVFAQDCQQIPGVWQVEEHTSITYNIGGQISNTESDGAGPVTIEQNGCQIRFESQGVNPIDGSIIRLSRDGTLAGNKVTYTGEAGVIIPGATYSENYIAGIGVIDGNTMVVTNVGTVRASVQGIPILVTISGTTLFTRSGMMSRITGEVRLDSPVGALAPGVTVWLTGSSVSARQTQTDSSGRYTFTSLQPGSYSVLPEATGFIFEPASQTVNLTQNVELPVFTALRIPSLRIVRIWSDQLELQQGESNFLPPANPADLEHSAGAGRVGNAHNYILMGARADSIGYLKARIELDPLDSILRDRLIARLARVDDPARTPIGNSPVFNGDLVSLSIDLNQFPAPANALVGYVVVAWIDLNENGLFDSLQGEVLVETEPPSQIIIIPQAHYYFAQAVLTGGSVMGTTIPIDNTKHPIAANFLYAFATGNDPTFATRRLDSTVCASGELDFNVGSIFNSDGCGFIYQYEFDADSRVGKALQESRALREAVGVTLDLNRQRIQDEFNSNPDKDEVTCELIGNERRSGAYTGSKLLIFGNEDQDLGWAFGTATLTEAYLTVQRREPNGATIRGRLVDLYDWNYEESVLDRMAAAVQAGYSTLGRNSLLGDGGRVFRLNAFFGGAVRGIRVDGAPFLSIGTGAFPEPNRMVLTVSGAKGSRISIEDSDDLHFWAPLRSIVLSNVIEDLELSDSVSKEKQFFRARVVNP